jgi:hypothetical protein
MCQESTPPKCPACGAIAARAVRRGRVRWRCPTVTCPVVELTQALPREPGEPARRSREPSRGPAPLWPDDEKHYP